MRPSIRQYDKALCIYIAKRLYKERKSLRQKLTVVHGCYFHDNSFT